MNNRCLVLLSALVTLLPLAVRAQTKPEFSVETLVANRYVWRGIVVTDKPVLQPSVTAGLGGFSANIWGNVDLENGESFDLNSNEIDYTADYSMSGGPLDFSVGAIHYTFPGTSTNATTEIYLGAGYPSLLNPSITVYRDVQDCDGAYVSAGMSPSFGLDQWSTSLEMSLSLGYGSGRYNAFYYGDSGGGLTDLFLGLGMPFALSSRATLTPGIAYVELLADSGTALQGRERSLLVSMNLSTTF